MAWIETKEGEVINLNDAYSMRIVVDDIGKAVKIMAAVPYSNQTLAVLRYAEDDQKYTVAINGTELYTTPELIHRAMKEVLLCIAGLAGSQSVFRQKDIDNMIYRELA